MEKIVVFLRDFLAVIIGEFVFILTST